MIIRIYEDPERFSYQDVGRFAIRFFLRQLGVADDVSSRYIEEGLAIFESLPIDNRYYCDFAYDERYLTVVEAE